MSGEPGRSKLGSWQGGPPAWRGANPRVVVLPFAAHDYDGYQIVYARRLAEWLATRLQATDAVEAAFPLLLGAGPTGRDYARLTRLPEPSQVQALVRPSGARWAVFGRFNLREHLESELFVLDVASGDLVLGEAADYEPERSLEALTVLALQTLRVIGVPPLDDDARSRLFEHSTRSIEALQAALLAADLLAQPDRTQTDRDNGLAYAFAALRHDPAFRVPADLVIAEALAMLDAPGAAPEHGLALVRRLAEAAPGYHKVAATIGMLWQRGGDHQAAVEAYREALRLSPDHPYHLYRLGVSLDALDDQAALPTLQAAVDADPTNIAAQDLYAAQLANAGRLDEARSVWEAQLARDPQHAPALTNVGAALEASGDLAQAADRYAAATRANPRYGPALDRTARLAERQGDDRRAIEALERLAAVQPADAVVLDRLAQAQARANQPEGELATLRRLSELRPDYWPARFRTAARLRVLGRRDEAIDAYRRVLASNPDHVPSLIDLGVLLGGKRQLTEAATYLERALRLAADDPAVVYNTAIVQMERGDWVRAEALLQQVKTLTPDDPMPDRALVEIARRRARGY